MNDLTHGSILESYRAQMYCHCVAEYEMDHPTHMYVIRIFSPDINRA